jgi:hypothetical protein
MFRLPVWVNVEGRTYGERFTLHVTTWHPSFWWGLWREMKWIPLHRRAVYWWLILWHAVLGDWHVNRKVDPRLHEENMRWLAEHGGPLDER